MKKADISEEIIRFTNDIFGDTIDSIILTGSLVDGNYNEQSDIDVICLTSRFDYLRTESVIKNGLLFQMILLPVGSLYNIFWREYISRDIVYISMLQKGVVLKDNDGIGAGFCAVADIIYKSGPPGLKFTELQKRVHHLSSLSSDIRSGDAKKEYSLVLMEAVTVAIELFLRLNNEWYMGTKFMMRVLKEKYAACFESINRSIEAYFIKRDIAPFLNLAEDILSIAGGPVIERNSYHLNLINSGPLYFVQLSRSGSFTSQNQAVYAILKNWADSQKLDLSAFFLFRTDPIGDVLLQQECIYLALDCRWPLQAINEFIQILTTQNPELKIFHPVNYELLFFLGNKEILESTIPVLNHIYTNYTVHQKDDNNNVVAIGQALYLLELFDKSLVRHNITTSDLWKYCLRIVRAKSMDSGKVANLQQLLSAEKRVKSGIEHFIVTHNSAYRKMSEEIRASTSPSGYIQSVLLIDALIDRICLANLEKASILFSPGGGATDRICYHLVTQVIIKIFETLMIPSQQYYFLVRLHEEISKDVS